MPRSGAHQVLAANPSAPWRELYPFESHFLDLECGSLHFVDEGPREADPILMVHGNPTWSFYYRNLIQRLSPRFRTVAVDHLGCGLSDKPQDFDYCLQKHRDNLNAVVSALNLRRVTLVAHDWGGAIGLAALLEDPKRFKRIVLLNTGAFPPWYIPFRIQVCRWPLIGRWGVRGLNLFARAATRMATTQPGGLPTEVAAGLLAPYSNWANRIAIDQFVQDIPRTAAHRTWGLLEKVEAGLASLEQLPKALIWGMQDWCFRPDCLAKFIEHWPNAEVHRLADAGHYVLEDAPDQVGNIIARFLEDHPV